MSSADWEEVRRLAADFQRALLSSTAQSLSERNCIEIVNKLVEDKLLDVIHTNDGKEYLTHAQLTREIRDELIVHGGRINLVDLQEILNVDFSHVETKANDIVKADKSLTLILGQLIDTDYLDKLADEINDALQESGQVTIGELTKQYGLPGDFITEVIEDRLGTIIQGQMDQYDRGVIFTEAFVARHTAQIRGVFSAITRPTQVINILNQYKFQEKLFYTVVEDLVNQGRLKGSIVGGRQDKSSYVPDIYAKTQNDWVDSFYKQNGYLEYDTLARLGITDGKSYVKRKYKSEKLVFLQSVCVGKAIRDNVEASLDEALSSNSWLDITPLLPSPFTESDANQLLQHIIKEKTGARIFCDSIVASQKFINNCHKPFESLMRLKAESDSKNATSAFLQEKDITSATANAGDGKKDKREERRKRAGAGSGSTHSGGGGNAREVKTKKMKKSKGRGGGEEDEEDTETSAPGKRRQTQEIKFMSVEEIEQVLSKNLNDCSEEFISEIASEIHRPLTKAYQDIARSVFLEATGEGASGDRRKTHSELQDKVNGLWINIKLFEKGIRVVGEELQIQLSRYLLKTLCSDISNLLFETIARENMVTVRETTITPEIRAKLLTKFPDRISNKMSKLHASLAGKTFDDFSEEFEDAASLCDVMLKKTDKKKERQLVFNHRQALMDQLRNENEPAMALHLATVLLFQTHTHCMIHAPGRCVPQLIAFLADYLPPEQLEKLQKFQSLVQKRLGTGRERQDENEEKDESEDNRDEDAIHQLNDMLPTVKEIALAKKSATTAET
ncbi:E3 UFM1-protein ligase 1-like [Ptychodera flava]|uniref:E3 UFM1-protein ligase 1-like n=1 Tax=Ptychodera flava TaxID=63121 RepID=UPI003969FA6E